MTGERGYIARFVGDGVLAYFGWPNADEAHAESAVRAGLAIIDAVGPQQLSVRIGIATGLVVTGDLVGVGAAQTMTAVGETPNLAARLQSLAQPDTIVVSEATRSQLGQMFDLEDLGLHTLKGLRDAGEALACAREDRGGEPLRGGLRERAYAAGRPRRGTGSVAAPVARGKGRRWSGRVALRRGRYRQVAPARGARGAAGRRAA